MQIRIDAQGNSRVSLTKTELKKITQVRRIMEMLGRNGNEGAAQIADAIGGLGLAIDVDNENGTFETTFE